MNRAYQFLSGVEDVLGMEDGHVEVVCEIICRFSAGWVTFVPCPMQSRRRRRGVKEGRFVYGLECRLSMVRSISDRCPNG